MRLMAIYAHPDDESTCAGGVLARVGDSGVPVVLVTCTGGEFGDGPDGVKPGEPGHDPQAVAVTRRRELDAACRVLGVDTVERLGFHDSGMPGWERLAGVQVFSLTPVTSVAARIGELLDRHRPNVVLTHNASATHEHRDHVHTARAVAQAVAGRPVTLYFSAHGTRHWQALAAAGIRRPSPDWAILDRIEAAVTTRVAVADTVDRKRAALFSHVSQLRSSLAAQLPAAEYAAAFGVESFIRVQGDDQPM
jgi:LmbE family N-acetylglucosaminyl deacetylase